LAGLESLDDAGKAQTPVSGSQTWSVIVLLPRLGRRGVIPVE
jgi:hypothetical protein